jgi:hypothetical protein
MRCRDQGIRALPLCLLLLTSVSAGAQELAPPTDRARYEGDCAFCWIDGSEPDMPIWSEEAAGWRPQSGDTRETVVLDETFFVRSGRSEAFRNRIVRIRPTAREDIVIYGTLRFEGCLILWDQTEHQQTRLRVKNGGRLEIVNSYSFSANGFWVNWEFEPGSTIRLDRFVGDAWTSVWAAVDYEAVNFSTVKMSIQNQTSGSNLRIRDAHHLWLEIIPPVGRRVDVALPPKRRWSDWPIGGIWPGTTIEIVDSYIYQRDISLSPGTHVTVRDTPDGFSFGWAVYRNEPGFVTCELDGLGDPTNDRGALYEHRTWSLPPMDASLTVIDSRVERAWPTAWGNVHLIVRDSNLADPRVWDGPATMEIYDSVVDHAAAYRGGRIYLENCEVRYDIEVKSRDAVVYAHNLRPSPYGPIDILELDGGRYVELDEPGLPW